MAASDTTRMLVLGVAQIFGPANGYQLRRELLSWNVQHWANINPGSIYSMLSTLTKQGMVERHDLVMAPGANPVAVYRITAAGDAEVTRLVGEGITGVREFDRTEFYAAVSLAPTTFDRERFGELIASRIENLRGSAQSLSVTIATTKADAGAPPHVVRFMDYASEIVRAEAEWLERFLADVRAGELAFRGEPQMESWAPPDDDSGWPMMRERAAYLAAMDNGD